MNPDVEDRKIKALFQELRRVDAQHAPPFPASQRAAPEPRPSFRLLAMKLAAAGAVLTLLIGGALYVARRLSPAPSEPQKLAAGGSEDPGTPTSNAQVEQEGRQLPAPAPTIISPPHEISRQAAQFHGRRREVQMLISEWRSPTECLLKVPGEEWLGIPRLGEPLMDLPASHRDRRN